MGKCCDSRKCDCSLFSSNPNLFDTSQWGSELSIGTWYVVYKVVLAMGFVAVVSLQFVYSQLGPKWLIFMTSQGIALLTISYVLDASLVLVRWCWEICHQDQVYHRKAEINWLYKMSWVASNCAFDLALFISVIYWSVLHRFVQSQHLLKTKEAVYLNFFIHGVNSISCLVDVFLNRRPIKALHFYFAMVYGVLYAVFSVVYWQLGGLGMCVKADASDLPLNDTSKVIVEINGVPFECAKYIYPILNWETNPLVATGTIGVSVLLLPVIHFIWLGLYHLRLKLFSCTMGRRVPQPLPTEPVNYERPLLMQNFST